MNKHSLIIAIVNRGFAETAMEAAKSHGARGGTIVHARGTSTKETEKFLGITIEPEKDLLLILIGDDRKKAVMKAIDEKIDMKVIGRGIIFSLPVDEVIGTINSQKPEDN